MTLYFMEGIGYLIRFFFGAGIFSFLTRAADRLPRGESVLWGRSHCDSCRKALGAGDLIPCVSFLLLRGKCRGCGAKIPLRSFAAETLGGAALIACGIRYGTGAFGILSPEGAVIFAYMGILLMVALIDWDTQIIYDRFHILIFALGCAAVFLFPEHGIMDRLIGAASIAGPMLILSLIISGAFGGGDIKLMAASGWLLGFAPIVVAAILGILTGGAYAAFMLARRRLARKDHFAFGPFLAFGLAAAALYGEQIAEWYLRFLG